ncbi:ribonuclease H-like domain-containing protein [bacterium]|nr:ribonuclease H-like domain-containing protein [bacterium]
MKNNRIVLDLETQKSFDEVRGRNLHLLRVSVVGIYLLVKDQYMTFEEEEIPKLEEILKEASLIIGFNQKRFDLPVLQPYLSIPASQLPTLDIMQEITEMVGHRVSLQSVALATLGEGKSGHGLDAIRYFRQGEMDKLKKYCLDDVRLTKELYEYGLKHGQLSFTTKWGRDKQTVPVKF